MLNIAFLLLIFSITRTYTSQIYHIPIGKEGNGKFYWTLNYQQRVIKAEVHIHLNKTDWFAIGFSNYGQPTEGDYCVFWVDWRLQVYLQDTWTDEEGNFILDDQQNCKHFQYKREHNITKFTFERNFDTCDNNDYIIEDGTTHVVWVHGKGPLFNIHGLNLNSATSYDYQMTQILKNTNEGGPHPKDTWKLEVVNQQVRVPNVETTYYCHVQPLPKQLKRKHHVIQYEPAIEKGHEHVVHHMEVFHCEAPADEDIPLWDGPCFSQQRPKETEVCKRVLAAWAMGATPFVYPEEAGLPIGGPDYNLYVMLEVHYHNPDLLKGIIDSSGIRLYVTPTLRPYDGGVIELGLEYTDKLAIPPLQPAFELSGFCVMECTAVGIPQEGIFIFGSQLHTHLTGIKVITRHVRDGRELLELNRDNHYSQHFQEIRLLKNPVRIIPGDALITTCVYNTTGRHNVTLGGFSITDEMCVNYVHYYPKTELEVCKSSISYEALSTYFTYMREWENQATRLDMGISDNYKAIEWSRLRVQVLQDLYNTAPLSMQCNESTGQRFPGYWENIPLTQILFPLPPRHRECLVNRD